jgi:hypothetical protein
MSEDEYLTILAREEKLGCEFVEKFIKINTDGRYNPNVGAGWEHFIDGWTRTIKFCIDTDMGYC